MESCLNCGLFFCICGLPEPAEPEEMTVDLAKAYIKMEIDEVELVRSQSAYWETHGFLDGKREGLQLALGILNQTA